MIPRNPRITFENALPHWAPNQPFAQITNAGSTCLPAVETYLNRVVARAAREIADTRLKQDIALFSAQEGNHYRQHRLFNRLLYPGYPGLETLDSKLASDYEAMLASQSLLANAAYCEGFECLGIIQAEFFFERIGDLLAGADPRLVRLWKWHLAEEFEHRTVCYDVHRALNGGYISRIRGFLRAALHLGRYGRSVSDYLLSVDRAQMTSSQRRHSRQLERSYRARLLRFSLPRLLCVLLPTYNPRRKRAPRGAMEFLSQIRPVA